MRGRIFVVGSANMDLVLRVPRLPFAGETLRGSDLDLIPGGKGANQACAAAWLGGDVHFVGCTGTDTFGPQILQSLTGAGVNVTRMLTSSRPTGCASIYLQPSGENSIVISSGANADLHPEHVRTALQDLSDTDFVLLQLEIPLETVQFTLELAKAVGVKTILDPAPAIPLKRATLDLVHILTPNETEAAALLGRKDIVSQPDDCELARLGDKTLELGPESVILKLGSAGCSIFSEGISAQVNGFKVNAVDTTAAGDVFNGALAVGLTEGLSLAAAAHFANAAAALSVTRSGAQTSVPTRNETDEFIRNNPAMQLRHLPTRR